ncbi:MAG TPA: glycosyltransferase [Longimicrobiales bacterium]|nr:glycosyltransferase [Longimicrobiales bacterium]
MKHPAPIRLVLLLQDLEFGGTQRYALQLVRRLDRRWFAPEVWVLRGGDDLLPPMLAAGVEVVRLSDGGWVGPVALTRLAWSLWRKRPGLLYTLTVVPDIWGRLFAGVLRIPVVSGYRGIEPDRIAVIPNGVDCDDFAPDDTQRADHPLVVCAARLVDEKDLPTLLEAFRLTRLEVPGARLDIIGNGPVPSGAPSDVRFLPGTEDVRAHLQSGWVFALASRSEASPNALLEAMACGAPVVATRVGGIPELVEDGVNGLLVPPDDPVAMSAALTALLRDGGRRQVMGAAGRKRAETRFRLSDMVRATETVLREVAQLGSPWTTTADGEVPPELPLAPGAGATEPSEVIVERGRSRPDRSLRQVTSATLTAFLPPRSLATGRAVVICPGGGYSAITIDREGYDVARWLAGHGVAGLVLKYRLPRRRGARDGVPWPFQDVMRALELARGQASSWGIDDRRVGVMGFSAGGHMAAHAAAADRTLAFAALVYPVISMEPHITHKGSRRSLLGPRPTAGTTERYSFERRVAPGSAPTFLVHAHDDDVARIVHSQRFAAALRQAGIPHECLFYRTGGHGFGLGAPGIEPAEWPLRFLAWLNRLGLPADA